MELIATEDSYADRRQLFKDIWDTAMLMEDKDPDLTTKTKVIKTLRLDDDDKFVIGKRKKERIKNLRTVCNKILDYCDRQDADEGFYDQMAGTGNPVRQTLNLKPKKLRTHRKKKKITRTKSLHEPSPPKAEPEEEPVTAIKPATSDRKNDIAPKIGFKFNKTSIIRRALVTNYNVKVQPNTDVGPGNAQNTTRPLRRKVIKKKRTKKKKSKGSSEALDLPEEWGALQNDAQNKVEKLLSSKEPLIM